MYDSYHVKVEIQLFSKFQCRCSQTFVACYWGVGGVWVCVGGACMGVGVGVCMCTWVSVLCTCVCGCGCGSVL